jgi:hypothetical protein
MNVIVIVGIVFFAAVPLTWGVLELIEFFTKKRGKQVHYVYYSRKLNKTIDVDKVGE